MDVMPDFELLDHAGNLRRLSDLAHGDPVVLQFFRGWWCPKEQAFFRRLIALQDEAEVAYCRFVSVSVDPPEVNAAFRAGLGARWTFLSDPDRRVQEELREGYTRMCADRAHELARSASPPLTDWEAVVEPSIGEGPALLGFVAARIAEVRGGTAGYHAERARQADWLAERLGLQ